MTNPPFANSSRLARPLALLALLALLACAPGPQTRPEPRATPPRTLPVAPEDTPEPPTEALLRAVHRAPDALEHARGRALEQLASFDSPAGQAAREIASNARRRVAALQQGKLPAALFAAQQRVALASFCGDLVGVYPMPGGKPVSDKVKKAAQRGSLKPGELIVTYPKAGKTLQVQLYDPQGRMRPEAYIQLSQLLYSPGESELGTDPWIAYHPRVFAMLYFTAQHFDKPLEIVSAFRIPERGRGRSSNHWTGQAVDFKVQGVSNRKLLNYLDNSFCCAGIGWYPNSSFVHLDTRQRAYYWTDRSRPGKRQRNRERKPGRRARPGSDPTAQTLHLSPATLYQRRR